MEGHREESR